MTTKCKLTESFDTARVREGGAERERRERPALQCAGGVICFRALLHLVCAKMFVCPGHATFGGESHSFSADKGKKAPKVKKEHSRAPSIAERSPASVEAFDWSRVADFLPFFRLSELRAAEFSEADRLRRKRGCGVEGDQQLATRQTLPLVKQSQVNVC